MAHLSSGSRLLTSAYWHLMPASLSSLIQCLILTPQHNSRHRDSGAYLRPLDFWFSLLRTHLAR